MRAAVVAVFVFVCGAGGSAHAATLGFDGKLVFAPDALRAYSFEASNEVATSHVSTLAWDASTQRLLVPTRVSPADWDVLAPVGARAPHGGRAVRIEYGDTAGLVVIDDALAMQVGTRRFSVTMWGHADGAEPVLVAVYGPTAATFGPFHAARVVAVPTGRETPDGWAEYGTGPIDGSVWGLPLRGFVLTARFANDSIGGANALTEYAMTPANSPPAVLDPEAFALIDALEVRLEAGEPVPPATCLAGTSAATCGPYGECLAGHCVDASVVWGVMPGRADQRADMAARWRHYAGDFQAARASAATAPAIFDGDDLSSATGPRALFGTLAERVTAVRDAHTYLGDPPSYDSSFYPFAFTSSAALDVCFGLVRDDVSGDPALRYAVFATGSRGLAREPLHIGDVVTAIDGDAPDAWIEHVSRGLGPAPDDPSADATHRALHLANLIAMYATTVTLSRCVDGPCVALAPIDVGTLVYNAVRRYGDTGGHSLSCTPRLHEAVTVARGGDREVPVVETSGGVSSVQFDGFAPTSTNFASWLMPFRTAFRSPRVLVDTRLGYGGYFRLGVELFDLLRGTDEPYGMLALPRGAVDEPDPPWLVEAPADACASPSETDESCAWRGGQFHFADAATPVGGTARVAWLVSEDVSMNDIVPRLLAGRANFRVFGPHATMGAFGEISLVPPLQSGWGAGSVAVLDTRFGRTPDEARSARWESSHGVVPDTIVVQSLSDLLADRDTVLDAARAWVSAP